MHFGGTWRVFPARRLTRPRRPSVARPARRMLRWMRCSIHRRTTCGASSARRPRQDPRGPAAGRAGNAGRPVAAGASGIRPRTRGRGRGAGPHLRRPGRPHQSVPAPGHAPVDQRAVLDRPAARHPPGGRTAGRAPRLAARRAPRSHGVPGPDAVGKPALRAARPTAPPTSTACSAAPPAIDTKYKAPLRGALFSPCAVGLT